VKKVANQYTSFYLEDLQKIILTEAMTSMGAPKLHTPKNSIVADDTEAVNDRIAHYNDGIREFALKLISALEKLADGGDEE